MPIIDITYRSSKLNVTHEGEKTLIGYKRFYANIISKKPFIV